MSSRAAHIHPTHRTTTASGMRRNLFNSTLSRRPTAPSTTSATSATTLHLADVDDEEEGAGRQGDVLERDRDMVARDEDGNYRLDMPTLVPLPPDEESEEKEAKTHLVETYRRHQQQTHPEGTGKKGDEERENCSLCMELQATLRASLHAKVDSLEEDKWIFEGEDPKMMFIE